MFEPKQMLIPFVNWAELLRRLPHFRSGALGPKLVRPIIKYYDGRGMIQALYLPTRMMYPLPHNAWKNSTDHWCEYVDNSEAIGVICIL